MKAHGGKSRSVLSGMARDVVQARNIAGGIHFHCGEEPSVPVPHQLPTAVGDFTGRAHDLATLDRLLPTRGGAASVSQRPGAVVISAIDGAAGIGKTTLAVYWGHRVRDHFPDGTLYTNLRGYGPGHPAEPGEVLEGFLRALGVPPGRIPTSVDEQAALYRSVLDGRRVLVILDNARTPEQVRPLLPADSGCLALVTSRSSLNGLIISHGAARISIGLLTFEEAVEMLRGIVGDARATAEPKAVAGIARACALLPLALRIAGQRASTRPHLSLAEVCAELDELSGRLAALSSIGDEVSAIRAVFTWSYEVLPIQHAQVFRRLGLHPGTDISVHAAAALADLPPNRAYPALEALAECHLVEPAGRNRYRAHDLLRAYALERAEDEEPVDELREAARRMLAFYAHTADSADRRLIVRWREDLGIEPVPEHPLALESGQQARAWFKLERANLVASVQYAIDSGQYLLAWQLHQGISAPFERDCSRHDWVKTIQLGLSAARALDDPGKEASSLNALCIALAQLRQFDGAIAAGRRAVTICREAMQQTKLAQALEGLGFAFKGARRFGDAIARYTELLSISSAHGNLWHAAIILNLLGDTYTDLGRCDEAIDNHRQAVATFRDSGDATREGWSLRLLGDAYRARGQLEAAIASHRQALVVLQALGYRVEEGRALAGLGDALHQSGDDEEAERCWKQSLSIFDEIDDPQADDIRTRLRYSPNTFPGTQ